MAKFPDNATIGRFNPEEVTIRQKTLVSQFDELGKEKRKRKWVYPKNVNVVITAVDATSFQDLMRRNPGPIINAVKGVM